MIQRILDYLRYELPENLFGKILSGFLGMALIGCFAFTLIIRREMHNLEKSIIQLQYERDSIRIELGKKHHSSVSWYEKGKGDFCIVKILPNNI